MARLVEEIILKVGVDTSKVDKALAGVDGKLKRVSNSTSRAGKSSRKAAKGFTMLGGRIVDVGRDSVRASKGTDKLGSSLLGFGKAAGAIAGVTAVIAAVAKQIENLTEASLDAQRLGIVTQELINLQNVGKQFGATADDVTQGIKNINESASEAFKDQKGEKFELFKELNIDLEKFTKLNPSRQLEEFSKAIQGAETQGRRTAIQLALMGEEGFKLSGTFDALAKDAEGFKRAAEGLTGSVDPEKIKELNEAWVAFKQSLTGALNTVINIFGPAITEGLKMAGVLTNVFTSLDNIAGLLEGTDAAVEQLIDAESRRAQLNFKHAQARKKQAEDEKKALQEELERKKRLERFVSDERRQIKIDAEALQNRLKMEVESDRKIAKEKAAIKKKEAEDDIKSFNRTAKRKNKEIEDAKAGIREISFDKKRARLEELRDRLSQGGANAVEAGGIEAARLQSQNQNRNVGDITQINKLELEISEEEKRLQEEQLRQLERIASQDRVTLKASSLR